MQAEPEAWRRVADAVIARRAHRGWTQIDVATKGAFSLDRVQTIEGAKRTRYRAGTIAALERALEWEHGSVEALLSGGEPTPIDTAGEAPAEMDPREARIRAMKYLSDAEKDFYVEQLHVAEENARRRNAAKEADVRRGA